MLFGAMLTGCASDQPWSPAQAALRKSQFLLEHKYELNEDRSNLIRQIPHSSRRELDSTMSRVLRYGSDGVPQRGKPAWQRRRVLQRSSDDVYQVITNGVPEEREDRESDSSDSSGDS